MRCLFLIYVIYAVYIQTGFTCNLVQLLTFPQHSVIKIVEELADSNLPILIPSNGESMIFNMTHADKEWEDSHLNLQLLENSSTNNIETAVNKLQRRIYFIPDEIDLNKVINSLTESGLIDHQKVIYKRRRRREEEEEKNCTRIYEEEDSTEPTALDMEHIYLTFIVWDAGIIIVTFAFLLEVMTYTIKNR
ncbi:hypothetical protein FQA39_LY10896 [Lamprigera yunnana]|nr:hypothetical protein FQA39_LY10896 [Lamprigera yunnana]